MFFHNQSGVTVDLWSDDVRYSQVEFNRIPDDGFFSWGDIVAIATTRITAQASEEFSAHSRTFDAWITVGPADCRFNLIVTSD